MRSPHVFAAVPFPLFFGAVALFSQSTSNIVNLPQTMHLCTDHCETLVWVKDHFDGKSDSDGTVISTYTVEKWTSHEVSFTGKALKLPVKAVFKGTIASQGGSIANPSVDVQVNTATIITGAPYQLTWTEPQVPKSPPSAQLSASVQSASPLAAHPPASPSSSAIPEAYKSNDPAIAAAVQAQLQAYSAKQAQLAADSENSRDALLAGLSKPAPQKKRFSADEAASHLRNRIAPVYPKNESRRPLPTEFYAEYEVVIGLDGKVKDMRAERFYGDVDPNAARESVRAAIYNPFFQDGHPVECITTIVIKYTFHCSDPQDPSTCK